MINIERRSELIDAIRNLTMENGHAPTVREIADELGISLVVTHGYLSRARKKSLVTWTPHKSRTIRLMEVTNEQQA